MLSTDDIHPEGKVRYMTGQFTNLSFHTIRKFVYTNLKFADLMLKFKTSY